MFLLRTAFWLTLVILLLPTNEGEQVQILGTAEAAIKDVRTFCVRNPGVCEKSRNAFNEFGEKAQFGAKMLMKFFDEEASPDGQLRTQTSLFGREKRGTLTDDDLQPTWSGSQRESGV